MDKQLIDNYFQTSLQLGRIFVIHKFAFGRMFVNRLNVLFFSDLSQHQRQGWFKHIKQTKMLKKRQILRAFLICSAIMNKK